jgi:hypothetical protein
LSLELWQEAGMSGLLTDTHMARASGLRQWRSGVRGVVPRLCCRCGFIIWPGERHHIVHLDRPRKAWRRIHYAGCPMGGGDSFPAYRRGEGQVTTGDWVLIAFGWIFAALVFAVLFMALGYQW